MVGPAAVQARETSGSRLGCRLPVASAGVLVLEECHRGLPGGILSHVQGPIHYLDLGSGALQAASLAEFGAAPALLAGVSKLYASHCGLTSLEGLQHLASIRWLYLDHLRLEEAELLRLPEVLPAGTRLESLDVRGNPGATPAAEAALLASSLLAGAEYLNGRRLRRGS